MTDRAGCARQTFAGKMTTGEFDASYPSSGSLSKDIGMSSSPHRLLAGIMVSLLLMAGCTETAPTARTMETTPAGSSAGQAQPARTK
jgi:hypothetical protein